MKLKKGKQEIRVLEPGDTISCKGIVSTIASINYQEYYPDSGFSIEFTDTNGAYRSWKESIDGGKVFPKPKEYISPSGVDMTDIFRKYGY